MLGESGEWSTVSTGDPIVSFAVMEVAGQPCACDWNHSGTLESQDFFNFLVDFFAGAPVADFNRDGAVNTSDFFEFLTTFFAGC